MVKIPTHLTGLDRARPDSVYAHPMAWTTDCGTGLAAYDAVTTANLPVGRFEQSITCPTRLLGTRST